MAQPGIMKIYFLAQPKREKNEIIKKCNFVKIEEEQIEEEFSGVRSGTRDRNPIIGVHPQKITIFCLMDLDQVGHPQFPTIQKR